MATEIVTYLDTFFNYYDADTFLSGHLRDHDDIQWELMSLENKLMPNGAYRAGISYRKRNFQLDLFERIINVD